MNFVFIVGQQSFIHVSWSSFMKYPPNPAVSLLWLGIPDVCCHIHLAKGKLFAHES